MGSLIYLLLSSKATKKFIRAKITPSRGKEKIYDTPFFLSIVVASFVTSIREIRIFEGINRIGVGNSMEKVSFPFSPVVIHSKNLTWKRDILFTIQHDGVKRGA